MENPRYLMKLRKDFAIEAGWLGALTCLASESDWKLGKIPPSINEFYGPGMDTSSYQDYCENVRQIGLSRLMLYLVWCPTKETSSVGHICGKKFYANIEGWGMPRKNLLFREMFEKAKAALEHFEGTSETLEAKPDPRLKDSTAPRMVLVHDTQTGDLWATERGLAYDITNQQRGGGFTETHSLVKSKSEGSS